MQHSIIFIFYLVVLAVAHHLLAGFHSSCKTSSVSICHHYLCSDGNPSAESEGRPATDLSVSCHVFLSRWMGLLCRADTTAYSEEKFFLARHSCWKWAHRGIQPFACRHTVTYARSHPHCNWEHLQVWAWLLLSFRVGLTRWIMYTAKEVCPSGNQERDWDASLAANQWYSTLPKRMFECACDDKCSFIKAYWRKA